MKHKLISCLLVTTMIMTSVPVAFAMEHNQDKDSNKDASMNAVTSVMPVIAPDGGGDSNGIVLYGNERYKNRIEMRYGSWGATKTLTVTKESAKFVSKYREMLFSTITGVVGSFVGINPTSLGKIVAGATLGGIAGIIADECIEKFYTTLTDAAGKYKIRMRTARRVSVNILPGRIATLESGYQIEITGPNGKKVSKTFMK